MRDCLPVRWPALPLACPDLAHLAATWRAPTRVSCSLPASNPLKYSLPTLPRASPPATLPAHSIRPRAHSPFASAILVIVHHASCSLSPITLIIRVLIRSSITPSSSFSFPGPHAPSPSSRLYPRSLPVPPIPRAWPRPLRRPSSPPCPRRTTSVSFSKLLTHRERYAPRSQLCLRTPRDPIIILHPPLRRSLPPASRYVLSSSSLRLGRIPSEPRVSTCS